MAKIRITINGNLMDGHTVTFKAPCECTIVEHLDVRYVEDRTVKSRLFTMKDTHGNTLTGIGNLFKEGAYVTAVLDTVRGYAYLQNPDTNGYLEGRLGGLTFVALPQSEYKALAQPDDNTLYIQWRD